MDYSLDDVRAMTAPDVSLSDVRKMPRLEEEKAKRAEEMARYRDISDRSGLDNFFAGAGKAVSDLGNGMRQIGAGVADFVSPQSPTLSSLVTGQRPSRSAAVQADIDEAKKLDAPLMGTGAGLAGNIAGNVAMTAIPAAGVARGAQGLGMARTAAAASQLVNPTGYLGAMGAGGAIQAVQPVASDESRAANTALGVVTGGVGQGVVNGLGRIAQPVKNVLDPVRQKAVDTLRAAGVPLDLAQLTGSPTWGRVSSMLGDNLFTMGGEAKKVAAQKEAFARAALKTTGANAGAATSDVLGPNMDRINGVFKGVLDNNNVQAQPGWINDLVIAHAGALENEKQPVVNIVNRIFGAIDPSTGEIKGQVAYGIKKDLDRMASSSDTTQNHFARQARSALMDGINGSLSPADQQAFAQARGEFGNMKRLEGAIATDGSGEISPAKLANVMGQKANRGASLYGKGPQELVDLAQSGKQVLGDKTPNSGTAARLAALTALPGLALGGADATREYLKDDGNLIDALKHGGMVAGSVIAAPKAAQFIMNSPRISSALADGVTSPAIRGLLEMPQKNAIASQGIRALTGGLLAAPTMSYAQYMDAFDKAKTKQEKIELGRLYESGLPAPQQ